MLALTIALLVLGLASIYLVALGLTAVILPNRALAFLSSFAQTSRANLIEASCRAAIGVAMIVASRSFPLSLAWQLAGMFLFLSALWMCVFPHAHQRIALKSVASVAPFIRWIGGASIAMGIALGTFLLTS